MNPNANGRTWLSTESAAARLDMTVRAFRHFLRTERKRPKPRLTVYRINRLLRFKATEIDACVEPEPQFTVEEPKPLRIVRGAR